MGRRKTVTVGEESVSMVTHTFYDSKSHIEMMDATAKAMGKSRSAFIRWACDPHIEQHTKGVFTAPEFDLADKTVERAKAQKLEEQLCQRLQEKILPKFRNRDAYSVLRDFAVSLGTDANLLNGFPEVLSKLKVYPLTGAEPFDKPTLLDFILYGEAVLRRRAIEAEFEQYFKCRLTAEKGKVSAGGDAPPLVVKALAA